MSTISAGLTSGTALVSSGDTTGTLVFQTNGTTTAMTIGTNQVVTFAAAPVISGGIDIVTTTGTQTLTNKTISFASNTLTGVAPLASPTFTGTVTTSTADLLGSVRGNVTTVSASDVDCSAGNYFIKTASGGLTWTFSNAPATRSFSFLLELTNGGTGTQTWPAAVKWPGGTAPTLTTSGVDVLGFITDDGGTIWRGVMLMKDSK